MDFINVAVLEKFLPKYFEFLKPMELQGSLLAEKIWKWLCNLNQLVDYYAKFSENSHYLPRPELKFQSKSLPNILNGPVFPLYDILKVENMEDYIDLKYLKTHEQFEKLEIMTGRSIFSLLKPQKIKIIWNIVKSSSILSELSREFHGELMNLF